MLRGITLILDSHTRSPFRNPTSNNVLQRMQYQCTNLDCRGSRHLQTNWYNLSLPGLNPPPLLSLPRQQLDATEGRGADHPCTPIGTWLPQTSSDLRCICVQPVHPGIDNGSFSMAGRDHCTQGGSGQRPYSMPCLSERERVG